MAEPGRPAAAPAASGAAFGKAAWAAFLVLLILNYLPTLKWMVERWDEKGSYMSHGWLIPAICAWVLWQERNAMRSAPRRGSAWGLALVAGALCVHALAGLADVSSISGLTLVPLLMGFVAIRRGWAFLATVWFPIFFLAFMVPPPEFVISKLNFNLKLMASDMAAFLLNVSGLPAIRQGSFILFGQERLAIGDVCSGLRSLLALLSLSVLYAWMVRGRGKAHVIGVLAAAVPAAVVGNGIRIGLVSYLVAWLGQERVFKPIVGSWDLHLLTGALIFGAAFGVLYLVTFVLDRVMPARAP